MLKQIVLLFYLSYSIFCFVFSLIIELSLLVCFFANLIYIFIKYVNIYYSVFYYNFSTFKNLCQQHFRINPCPTHEKIRWIKYYKGIKKQRPKFVERTIFPYAFFSHPLGVTAWTVLADFYLSQCTFAKLLIICQYDCFILTRLYYKAFAPTHNGIIF